MKVKKYQASEERTILTAMIVSSEVLDRIGRNVKLDEKPFRDKWSNLVAKWCLEYWRTYGRSPRRAIETQFSRFAQATKDQDTVELLESFLASLSDDYKNQARETNVQYVVDLAAGLFKKVQLERMAESIEAALEQNDADAAELAVTGYQKIEFAATDWINPFDHDTIREALVTKEDSTLVQFKGALGEFLNAAFERDAFISFAGPEKRGKSYWLGEVTWQALRQRRRVLHYTVGDMSKNQLMRRLLVRAARRPLRSQTIEKPTRIRKKEGVASLVTESIELKRLSTAAATEAMDAVMTKTAAKKPRLKIKCAESSTISASDIERDIADLAKEDWVPDVVVIDYADILEPEPHAKGWDYRHQINETWKVLRRISQRYHILVVTATQTAATSYDTNRIKKGDFSEDKRKAAHVTGMIGINQTSDEKKLGIYRLNWIFLRDGVWTDSQVVWTAGNLALACPCMISSF